MTLDGQVPPPEAPGNTFFRAGEEGGSGLVLSQLGSGTVQISRGNFKDVQGKGKEIAKHQPVGTAT